MKTLKIIFVFALSISVFVASAQEKKIKFSKGTLKICSSKNFTIKGHNGNEVIIKSLHNNRTSNFVSYGRSVNGKVTSGHGYRTGNGAPRVVGNLKRFPRKMNDSIKSNQVYFFRNDSKRKKGLKKLGKKNENSEFGIYFTIEQKGNELIFKDNTDGQFIMLSNERYEILIPNSIKLNWQTNGCKEKEKSNRNYVFFNSKASSLSNFSGEVEISTSLNNMQLTDVTGPVSINSIGGNVTVVFDKKTPKKLYSVYSNNGFIDITLPSNSEIRIDATGNDIFSDIDFKVVEENESEGLQEMSLKLKSGRVKMKLNAGLGNVYLRMK